MNFMEAVKAMKEGKKVKPLMMLDGAYYFNDSGLIQFYNNETGDVEDALLFIKMTEATDWEIVK